MKKMSGGKIALISLGAVLALLLLWGIGSYNGLVSLREAVSNQSANIDTQLQRRSDLIPNLVETVRGYAAHETDVIGRVSKSRENLAGAQTMSEKAAADGQLSGALSRLMMIVENYPNLKADKHFTQLMDDLSGTESRVSTARNDYNNSVRAYNKKIKTFPDVIFASIFGFSESEYFEASEGSKQVPSVSFQ